MPRRSSSRGMALLSLTLLATPPLWAEERGAAEPPAEMLLDLDLLADRNFAAHSQRRLAEKTDLLDNLDWLESAAEPDPGRGRKRAADESVR